MKFNFEKILDDQKLESYIVIMTNQGEIQAFSTQNLRRVFRQQCCRKDDLK